MTSDASRDPVAYRKDLRKKMDLETKDSQDNKNEETSTSTDNE